MVGSILLTLENDAKIFVYIFEIIGTKNTVFYVCCSSFLEKCKLLLSYFLLEKKCGVWVYHLCKGTNETSRFEFNSVRSRLIYFD